MNQFERALNSKIYNLRNNGGMDWLPSVTQEQDRSVDSQVAWRNEKPSIAAQRYFDADVDQSDYSNLRMVNEYARNKSAMAQVDQLSARGLKYTNMDNRGNIQLNKQVSDQSYGTSQTSSSSTSSSETHTLLWVIIGVVAIVLISNAVVQ